MLDRWRTRVAALRAFRSNARKVAHAAGRSPRALFVEWLRLWHAIGVNEREYFLYELYRPDMTFDEKRQYLTGDLHAMHRGALLPSAYVALLDDKFIFKQYYRSLGFPMSVAHGVFHPLHGRTAAGHPLRTAADLRALLNQVAGRGLVVKHVMSGSGRSVLVFESVAGGANPSLVHVNGEHFSFDQILKHLTHPIH